MCTTGYRLNLEHEVRKGMRYREIWQETEDRNRRVREAGYNLMIIKEHEIARQLKANPEMAAWFAQYDDQPGDDLTLRHGIFGGRTGANSLLVELVEDSEYEIVAKDFVSM